MNIDLKGRKALISGSTLGIGFAIAKDFLDCGARVVINGRTQKSVDAALVKLREYQPQGEVMGVAADLGTAEGAARVTTAIPEVDILVNNVGIFEPKEFTAISDADWQRFFQVNVMSGVRLSRHYLPRMVKKNWGRILFISSESGLQIPPEMIHYGMTKTAMLAISRGLAESVAGTGVTVNSILPGPTKSDGVATFVEDLAKQQNKSFAEVERDFFATMRPSSLIQRFATPEEVAHMVAYVASPLASATTGAALRVDGGVTRSIG